MNNEQIFDEIRKCYVVATPEERVRQALLKEMINTLGFPKNLIAVEKELSSLPFIENSPQRRLDILCYAKDPKTSLRPLLVIECKAIPLKKEMLHQVIGYNHFVKAAFIALVNESQIICGWFDGKVYQFLPHLPPFEKLIEANHGGF